ncbi:hypothetical protein BDB00DRAFT_801460 [Zychaea mexicana]|uniref:uncharacterized protein n=1 Tax=Zychaea mexicana TaxID=64656 RepID=UPI0022FEE621|nr:uncharacterized protein BDB00DRAFT_801460 [Zychaea mexicana]KAI9498176.1 hypothetical protein BDB00DRAFT_801460 [Zychaea mexicana]
MCKLRHAEWRKRAGKARCVTSVVRYSGHSNAECVAWLWSRQRFRVITSKSKHCGKNLG